LDNPAQKANELKDLPARPADNSDTSIYEPSEVESVFSNSHDEHVTKRPIRHIRHFVETIHKSLIIIYTDYVSAIGVIAKERLEFLNINRQNIRLNRARNTFPNLNC
jgi:hypothetical protein